jgi:3'(2'), 5'-bisphosphate nucleotidase
MAVELPPSARHLVSLALAAGREIMRIYDGDASISEKSDGSPVTAADIAAEKIILTGLGSKLPIVAEEQAAAGFIPKVGQAFYLVDPLDGTREFIARNGEFTVNIARVENAVPVEGVVFAPALNRVFWGSGDYGAFEGTIDGESIAWRRIYAIPCPMKGAVVVASRSHRDQRTDDFLSKLDDAKVISIGSSLKFCLLAAGQAHLYPRFGPTMEWDTAAGHGVLLAAGGKVMDEDAAPLAYGKPDFRNPAFVAST